MDDHQLEDAVQSMMAQSHHIQTRLLQVACKGKMSDNVRNDLINHTKSITDRLERMGEDATDNT